VVGVVVGIGVPVLAAIAFTVLCLCKRVSVAAAIPDAVNGSKGPDFVSVEMVDIVD
jgi:hypothetical protein